MRNGKLKNKIEFFKLSKKEDDFGEALEDEINLTHVAFAMAEVSHIGTSEKYFNNRFVDEDIKKFRIHFIKDIDTTMQILFNGVSYDIKEIVDPYMSRKELLIAGKAK